MLHCNLCPSDQPPFEAPNDPIGRALMVEHLREEHNAKLPPGI